MSRRFSLSTIALVLACCGSVASQQGFMVEHNTKDDPCGRFKMRIVIPPTIDDKILPVKRFSGGIDAGMVWNPCPNGELQIAKRFPNSAPDGTRFLFSKPAFPVRPSTEQNGQREPGELRFTLTPLPFAKRKP